jgi:hypothetical protein
MPRRNARHDKMYDKMRKHPGDKMLQPRACLRIKVDPRKHHQLASQQRTTPEHRLNIADIVHTAVAAAPVGSLQRAGHGRTEESCPVVVGRTDQVGQGTWLVVGHPLC